MTLDLQHELDRRLALAKTADEKIKALEFILRPALKRLELAKPLPDLVSLNDHNRRRQEEAFLPWQDRPRLNGIACPTCGKELYDSNPNQALLTHPLQYKIHCSSCDYHGQRF